MDGVDVIRYHIFVIGFAATGEQEVSNHDKNLIKLLERVRKVNLNLNSSKMELKKPEVKFMGHMIISKDGLKADSDKEKVIQLR